MVICADPHAHDALHLEKMYLAHSFIDLNDFCCIGCAKWRVVLFFKVPKTTKWRPKILSSRTQIGRIYKTHMPMIPFTWKSHILFILSSIWVIFVALDVPCKGVQKWIELQRKQKNVQRFISLCPWVISRFILVIATKMQLKCLSHIIYHMFQICKLFKWMYQPFFFKWYLQWNNQNGLTSKLNQK